MLSTEEIELVRRGCDELDDTARAAFAVASVFRVLPAYQVYCEVHPATRGHDAAFDALQSVSLLIRGRKAEGAVVFAVDAALKALERDLVELEESDAGLAEAVVIEVVMAVSAALTAWRTPSADEVFRAVMGALEAEVVWAEGRDDAVVSETRLAELHQQQLRDLEELRAADPADPADTYREVLYRSEREGMPYLNGMEALLAQEGR